jgi:5-(carboxyamino)imidazole ribonucleotide mutase
MTDSTSSLKPLVAVLMGSDSDWEPAMMHASDKLYELEIPHVVFVMSAHRTVERLDDFLLKIEDTSVKALIAGAGGAAHLAGAIAARTILPVLGVPIKTDVAGGLDSLLSTVQMPGGVPVATFAIGKAGAVNAALFAASILGLTDLQVVTNLRRYRQVQTDCVPKQPKAYKPGGFRL